MSKLGDPSRRHPLADEDVAFLIEAGVVWMIELAWLPIGRILAKLLASVGQHLGLVVAEDGHVSVVFAEEDDSSI